MNATLPRTLNGYPIIKFDLHPNCATVMVDRGEDAPDRYTVATWWESLGETWMWGAYWADRETADSDFDQTARRNKRR